MVNDQKLMATDPLKNFRWRCQCGGDERVFVTRYGSVVTERLADKLFGSATHPIFQRGIAKHQRGRRVEKIEWLCGCPQPFEQTRRTLFHCFLVSCRPGTQSPARVSKFSILSNGGTAFTQHCPVYSIVLSRGNHLEKICGKNR